MHPNNSDVAFEDIFRKFYSVLVFFARKFVRDKPAAEDIVSDVFFKLWQRQTHFASIQSAKGYLYICTRNACLNYLYRAGYQAGVCETLRHVNRHETEDFALNQIVRSELSGQLLMQVGNLPPECRKVVRMSFLQGYTNREIAQKLQLSINTVRNQRARGIHLIRKRLMPV